MIKNDRMISEYCFTDNKVYLCKSDCFDYCNVPPFLPSERYPESIRGGRTGKALNPVYGLVRKTFHLAGLDDDHYGTKYWNPLGFAVHEGDKVVIKPNLVHESVGRESHRCLYTHPSVVAAVIDYVLIALHGRGTIIIGDAPVQETDFEKLVRESGYLEMTQHFQQNQDIGDVEIRLVDFRGVRSERDEHNVIRYLENDIESVKVNMGEESEFSGEDKEYYDRLRIPNYDPSILKGFHDIKKHEYLIVKDILDADVIINMPKPKTHRKAGVTAALKNAVGMIVRKECLPHHVMGSRKSGKGDEYARPSALNYLNGRLNDRFAYLSQTKKKYRSAWILHQIMRAISFIQRKTGSDKGNTIGGSWFGNDTISRTTVDINRALMYADSDGSMHDEIQRRYLIFADMIVSGEGDGPISVTPKQNGMLVFAQNPVACDEIISKLIGIKDGAYHTLRRAKDKSLFPIIYQGSVQIISNDESYDGKTTSLICDESVLNFRPPSGWEEAFN